MHRLRQRLDDLEAAAVGVLYALFVGFVIHKELKIKDMPQIGHLPGPFSCTKECSGIGQV